MLATRYKKDSVIEVGVDEAGRGPLWGPLMAAAVVWPSEAEWTARHREIAPQIKDSKKVSAKKREKLVAAIQELAVASGIGIVSAEEIDMIGATRANQLAFRRALEAAHLEGTRRILIDGVLPLNDASSDEEVVTLVDGDANQMSIAAASLVAKVTHDQWVIDQCKEHVAEAAKYDLLNCKGQGTAKHREGILKHGYTDLHRRLQLRKLIPDIVVSRYKIIEESDD